MNILRFPDGARIGRRRFLQLTAGGGLAWLFTGARSGGARSSSETLYRVGVGKHTDPYAATLRAVESTGEWPSTEISGKTVVIKPNLVVPMTADTGVTTDPEVVRALVDLALEDGAEQVIIVEGGFGGANFSACGYDFFNDYDPRVRLVDLNDEPLAFVKVLGGMAYHRIYMPKLLLADDVTFISAAKLKTHLYTHATLTMKNLIGLPPFDRYPAPPPEGYRWAMHYRGISQVIVDLNLIRPIDYAVVDGIWGMEGDGPVSGDPVRMNMVLAGQNPVAVDRACLWATALPQRGVMHLTYAARKGLGPTYLNEVEGVGDSFTQRPFKWPTDLPPLIEYPRVYPIAFRPNAGQEVVIFYWVAAFPCSTRVDIFRTSDFSPEVTHIRTLRDWERRPSGLDVLKWDGRDDADEVVSQGLYTVRVQAKYSDGGPEACASGWVLVIESMQT